LALSIAYSMLRLVDAVEARLARSVARVFRVPQIQFGPVAMEVFVRKFGAKKQQLLLPAATERAVELDEALVFVAAILR
jgi:hypothetical protein